MLKANKMEKQRNGVGRRKESVTRVFLTKGDGSITVNDKDYKTYFPLVYLQNQVERPFKTIDAVGKFDVKINAAGGGVKGQAEAAMLGIARITCKMIIDLLLKFVASENNFLSIYDNDVVTSVNVWSVRSLVLTAKDRSDPRTHTTHGLISTINNIPRTLHGSLVRMFGCEMKFAH